MLRGAALRRQRGATLSASSALLPAPLSFPASLSAVLSAPLSPHPSARSPPPPSPFGALPHPATSTDAEAVVTGLFTAFSRSRFFFQRRCSRPTGTTTATPLSTPPRSVAPRPACGCSSRAAFARRRAPRPISEPFGGYLGAISGNLEALARRWMRPTSTRRRRCISRLGLACRRPRRCSSRLATKTRHKTLPRHLRATADTSQDTLETPSSNAGGSSLDASVASCRRRALPSSCATSAGRRHSRLRGRGATQRWSTCCSRRRPRPARSCRCRRRARSTPTRRRLSRPGGWQKAAAGLPRRPSKGGWHAGAGAGAGRAGGEAGLRGGEVAGSRSRLWGNDGPAMC